MKDWNRSYLLPVLAAGGLVFGVPARVDALTVKFSRVVDTTDLMPEGLGADQPFRQFFYVSLDAGTVTFSGDNSLIRSGIYQRNMQTLGPIQAIATQTPLAPAPAGNYSGFGHIITEGGFIAFSAGRFGAPSPVLMKGTPGSLVEVADSSDPIPGFANNFGSFQEISLIGSDVVWTSQSTAGSHEKGICADNGGIHAVALPGDPTPGLAGGTFQSVDNSVGDGADVAFYANSTAPGVFSHNGIYLDSGAGPQIVMDSNTARPGGPEELHIGGRLALHEAAIATVGYWDLPTQPIPERTEGIWSTAGGLHVVADTSMIAPGGGGANFDLFANHDGAEGGGITIRDGVVAFVAYTGQPDRKAGLYLEGCGGVDKIIATGDLLDGEAVGDLFIRAGSFKPNPRGGYSVAFGVQFANVDHRAIYLADFDLPPGGVCGGTFARTNDASGVPLGLRMRSANASGQVRVERVNTATGIALTNMSFFSSGGMSGRQLLGLPNIGGTAADELAMLATRDNGGLIRAEIRDVGSRALLKSFTLLTGDYRPVWLFEVPDLDGDAKPDVGLLAQRKSDGLAVAKLVGSLSGSAIGPLVEYSAGLVPLMAASLPDLDGSGQPEVAVLAQNSATGRYLVQIRNALGLAAPRDVVFAADSDPLQLIVGPDKDSDSVPELAVLARRKSDGRALVEMRNAIGPVGLRRVFYSPGNLVLAFAQAGDSDGNTVPEWALLFERTSDHRPYTQLRNQTGVAGVVSRTYLNPAYRARQFMVMPDSDSVGGPDIGVIAQRNSDGRLRMEIRNSRGGGAARSFFFDP